jgi:hypothetical protein
MTAEVVDQLYGLPLEQFTPQRDLAARELRRAGDRDAAGEIAKLPKPTPAAWTANQVAREQPELIEAVLEAGEALRGAQEAALAGDGGGALREAMGVQRGAVDAVMTAAQAYRPAGRALSRAMADRLRTTLQAAAGDEGLSAALAAGRLVDEAQGGGAWPLGPEPEGTEVVGRRTPARAKRPAKPAPREEEDEAAAAAAREAAERERAELEAELSRLRGTLRVRERAVAAAEKEAGRAREAAVEAAERVARAQQAAEDARADAEAAAAAAGEARESLQSARDDVARLEERLD